MAESATKKLANSKQQDAIASRRKTDTSTDKSSGKLKQSERQKAEIRSTAPLMSPADARKLGTFKDFQPNVSTDNALREMTILPDPDIVLQRLGKVRADFEVIESDADVYQALDTRRDVVISSPLRIEPANSPESAFIAEHLFPYTTTIIESALQARFYGMSITQCRYEINEMGYLVLAGARHEPLRFFSINENFDLVYNDPQTGLMSTVDTDYRCIWTRCAPTVENPYGRALLSVLYWPWFFKNNVWRFLGMYLERCAVPFLIGKGNDPNMVAAQLTKLVQDAVAGIGRDDDVQMIEAARVSASDIFIDPMKEVTRIIQTVILGQTLTSGTDGGTGNRALGEVHEKVRQDKATADKRLVLPALQRPVDIMMAVNFPNSDVQVKVLFEENVGLAAERAARDKILMDAGAVAGFTREYLASSYGLPIDGFVSTLELLDVDSSGTTEAGGEVPEIGVIEGNTGGETNVAAGAAAGAEHETGNT